MNAEINNPTNEKVYSVSGLTREIKLLLEGRLPSLWVEGEVSNVRRPGSGHIYFTLKDSQSQLSMVIFRREASRLRFQLEDGLQILAHGRLAVYGRRGQYQLIASRLEPRGKGGLQLALEQLKKKLAGEGLFEERHKKPLPLFPRRIGVVTSATGAAFRDILQVIDRRFGNLTIIINPARVQGERAAGEIARAIREFNEFGEVDVLIVGRGGGSLEDLWPFNEEVVARAIFESRIPVISAVGHEIDWSISDLAADLRAPTPSAAAELVVKQKSELKSRVEDLARRLRIDLNYRVRSRRQRLDRVLKSQIFRLPERIIRPYQQRRDDLFLALNRQFSQLLEEKRRRFQTAAGKLEALSPLGVLGRGYSFTRKVRDGKIVKDASDLKQGESVRTRLARGSFSSTVTGIQTEETD